MSTAAAADKKQHDFRICQQLAHRQPRTPRKGSAPSDVLPRGAGSLADAVRSAVGGRKEIWEAIAARAHVFERLCAPEGGSEAVIGDAGGVFEASDSLTETSWLPPSTSSLFLLLLALT